ncbi:MAG TPA: Mpo1-like protein, partial [Noviherbaspirillum sp.]
MSAMTQHEYASFSEFYPDYLTEHSNRTCRELHFVGSTLALFCLAALLLTGNPWWILAALGCGYGFAWIGHFV